MSEFSNPISLITRSAMINVKSSNEINFEINEKYSDYVSFSNIMCVSMLYDRGGRVLRVAGEF